MASDVFEGALCLIKYYTESGISPANCGTLDNVLAFLSLSFLLCKLGRVMAGLIHSLKVL